MWSKCRNLKRKKVQKNELKAMALGGAERGADSRIIGLFFLYPLDCLHEKDLFLYVNHFRFHCNP
jgi:hypothetical protein